MKGISLEISLHDVSEIRVEHCVGQSGRTWLELHFVGQDGKAHEVTVWSPTSQAPELVVEDDVSIRRVQTIQDPPNAELDL